MDLLSKMIVFNPEDRITIGEALNHSYITSIKDKTVVDPVYTDSELNFDFDYTEGISIEELFMILINEIKFFDTGVITE